MDIKVLASSSKGNAYIVSDGETKLLLDCGLPYKKLQQASGFTLSNVDACLLTHEHKDHSAAAEELLKRGTDVYTSQGTAEALGLKSHRLHIMDTRKDVDINSFHVSALNAEHDAAEPFMFMIMSLITCENMLFATDTAFIKYKIDSLSHLMIEANYEYPKMDIEEAELNKRIMRSHMSLDAVEQYLNSINTRGLKQVYLIHLSDDRSDEAVFKKRVQELTGAEVYIA